MKQYKTLEEFKEDVPLKCKVKVLGKEKTGYITGRALRFAVVHLENSNIHGEWVWSTAMRMYNEKATFTIME